MAEKILAKDAKINSIYLTRGGKQADTKEAGSLRGFYPVRAIRKVIKDNTEEIKTTVIEMVKGYGVEVPDDWQGPVQFGIKMVYDGVTLNTSQKEAVEKKIKEMKSQEEVLRVIVFTPWQTELDLLPDYPLEVTDLQTLPSEDHFINRLIKSTKISIAITNEEAPPEYIEELKNIKEEEQAPENVQKNYVILKELEKGTPITKIAKMTGKSYQNVYQKVKQLQKKGYKIQKVGKGTFQIVK